MTRYELDQLTKLTRHGAGCYSYCDVAIERHKGRWRLTPHRCRETQWGCEVCSKRKHWAAVPNLLAAVAWVDGLKAARKH